MAYEQKPNSGSLFKNDNKTSDTHADYNGSALVDGKEYFMDAWINEVKSGQNAVRKYLRVQLKPKNQQGGGQSPAVQEDSGDIPF